MEIEMYDRALARVLLFKSSTLTFSNYYITDHGNKSSFIANLTLTLFQLFFITLL